MTSLAILGEFTPSFPPHPATNLAIDHTCSALGVSVAAEWIPTAEITQSLLNDTHGIWVAPGSPYKNMDKTLAAIQHARENGIPCFGTCGGFQHMVLEYARNTLKFKDAQHAEYDPYASDLFISELACSLAGRDMHLEFAEGSLVEKFYGASSATEKYYCNFGIAEDKGDLLRSQDLKVSGSDAEGDIRVIELPEHPFFIGTLFVPQARSTEERPHPLVNAFIEAVVANAKSR